MTPTPSKIAFCGLDCTECKAYEATRKNDFDALMELARRWSEQDDTNYGPEDLDATVATATG